MWQILGSLCDFACILLLEHAHSGNRVRGQLLREPLVHLALINLEREIPHEDGRTRGVDSLRRGEQTSHSHAWTAQSPAGAARRAEAASTGRGSGRAHR